MAISVDAMRRIDYWAGVPLCALASVLVWVGAILQMARSRPAAPPARLLFIELSEMGSAIIADPALREAQARGAEVHFLIFASNRQSLSLLNTVAPERVMTIDADSLFGLALSTLRFLYLARVRRIDTVIDMELFSRFTAILTGVSGARHRVGFHIFHGEGLWRGTMLTHRVQFNPHLHMAKNFMALVRSAYAASPERPYFKHTINDAEIRVAKARVNAALSKDIAHRIAGLAGTTGPEIQSRRHPLVLVNPNASDLLPQRRWAPERFSALIAAIQQGWPQSLVLVTGTSHEFYYVEAIRRNSRAPRAINFAGQVTLAELPALYALADVMVTNDSGPAHFSSVTDLPTIVLFGPETPSLYGSMGKATHVYAGLACSPCVTAANHRKTPCTDNVCMQAIVVDQVMEHVARKLEERFGHAN